MDGVAASPTTLSEPVQSTELGGWKTAAKVVLFFVILAGCFAVDEVVFQFTHDGFNHLSRPVPWIMRTPSRWLRSLEDWGENVFIIAVGVAIWQLDRRHRSRVLCIVISAALVALTIEGIKRTVGRERPDFGGGKLIVHGPAYWFAGGDYQSFPSGHTGAAAAYGGSLAAFYPPLRPLAIVLTAGCASSRIWKERHFLSDCFAGGVLGFWLATLIPQLAFMQGLCRRFDERFSNSDPASPP